LASCYLLLSALRLFHQIFNRTRNLEIESGQDRTTCMKILLDFCRTHQSRTRIDEFEPRKVTESSLNLPVQLGSSFFPTTKYRIIGDLTETDTGTLIKIKIKDDPYWAVINAITPVIILTILLNDQSSFAIGIASILLLASLIRWLLTSNNFEQIESIIKQSFL